MPYWYCLEMGVKEYLDGLSDDSRIALASKAKTSVSYIYGHLYYRRRTPKKQLMENLISATCENLSRQDWFNHFYPQRKFAEKADNETSTAN